MNIIEKIKNAIENHYSDDEDIYYVENCEVTKRDLLATEISLFHEVVRIRVYSHCVCFQVLK